jgi:ssDNA-binding replication factor A large subunit
MENVKRIESGSSILIQCHSISNERERIRGSAASNEAHAQIDIERRKKRRSKDEAHSIDVLL